MHISQLSSAVFDKIFQTILWFQVKQHCMESFSADLFSIYSAIVKILILGKGIGTMFLFHALSTFAWNVQV